MRPGLGVFLRYHAGLRHVSAKPGPRRQGLVRPYWPCFLYLPQLWLSFTCSLIPFTRLARQENDTALILSLS